MCVCACACVLSVCPSLSFPSPYRSIGPSGLSVLFFSNLPFITLHIKGVCVPDLAMNQSPPQP